LHDKDPLKVREFFRLSQWRLVPTTGPALDPLDGLRGIAILMVTCSHAFYFNNNSGWPIRRLGELLGVGWMGVPIFFVLSGFLISLGFWQARAKNSSRSLPNRYFRRRFFKIVPPFYLSLLVFVPGYLILTHNSAYWRAAFLYSTGLNNFVFDPLVFNPAYWSLIVEVQFYLVLPVLFGLMKSTNNRIALAVIVGLLFIVPLCFRWIMLMPQLDRHSFFFRARMFPNQLDYFAWGVVFAWFYVKRQATGHPRRALHRLSYVGIAVMLVTLAIGAWVGPSKDYLQKPSFETDAIFHILLGLSAFLLLFSIFLPSANLVRETLSHPALVFVGIISYEWFLFHHPFVILARELIGESGGNLLVYMARTVGPLIITFILSALIFRFFSLPILRKGRQDVQKPPVPIAAQAETTM
jgi:peptidoglycan/LPS O-acetylase OafA/YrhL